MASVREVAQQGGSVHFIGLAMWKARPFRPLMTAAGPQDLTDREGQPVVSRLDEATLIAAQPARHLHKGNPSLWNSLPSFNTRTNLSKRAFHRSALSITSTT